MEPNHEIIVPNHNLPFKMFLFEGMNGNYKRASHWHQSVEIFLVMEGMIRFRIESMERVLKELDFIIVNSNEVHSADAPVPNQTLVLQIPISEFEGYLENQPFLIFQKQDGDSSRELAELVMRMYHIYQEGAYGWELMVKGQFYLLQYLMLTRFRCRHLPEELIRHRKHMTRLSEISEHIRRHYREELSLERVADRFGFSPAYLSRIFKRYANINYRMYLTDLRVEYAVKELTATKHAIGDIAVKHGFSDSRAFSKAFRKRYGCRPSEYRLRQQNQDALLMETDC